ncbi:MAG: alpha-(1-_3)-arabinofuranosyltransferase family protein [Aquihabitans sp.]
MSPPIQRRLREALPSAILAAVVYIPLLLTRPGRVGADTKSYLYLDPSRMLSRAPSMWDPSIGLGTVTHQNIGYLWPIGPYYWLAEMLSLPDWVAQRIWLGSIMVLAGIGVRFMLKAMGQEGPHVTAATFVYALTPYVLTLGARLSVILLPYAGLPWLIGLTVLALRRRRWREPALFALVVASIGSVNATSLVLVGMGPILWIVHEVAVTREIRFRDALATVGRIAVLTTACSLWWLSGLWAQGGYGINILRYTETAKTVATASVSLELMRGLGYWFFYGEDRYGPWIAASRGYLSNPFLMLVSYLIPGLAVLGAAFTRFRERAFFLLLMVVGLLLAVGGHPWTNGPPIPAGIKAFLQSDTGLSMRSLPRAAPLVILASSVFVGSLVASIAAERARWARPLTAGVMVLALLGLAPLWQRQMIDANLDRAEEVPSYWIEAAEALDARDDGTRVLELPGSDFASYRWGNTVDPILPGLMDRPYVARELIPYGSPASAELLNALDHRIQELTLDPAALAPMARLLGVGDISVRSDLSYERYNTPRPRPLWDLLRHAPDVEEVAGFGPSNPNVAPDDLPLRDEIELLIPADLPDPPEVGVLTVADAQQIIRTTPIDQPLIVAGNGEGLVDLASVGLLSGHELILYSASYADDQAGLQSQIDRRAVLVLTDSNRRQGQRWGTVRDNLGLTERPDQKPMRVDPTNQTLDLFEDQDQSHQTIVDARGGVWADATTYGNIVSFTPEDDPAHSVDGNPSSAWRTGGFADAEGQSLRLTYREPVTTDRVRVLQAMGGVRNRSISRIEVRLDGGDPIPFDLTDVSHPETIQEAEDPEAPGQVLTFPTSTFQELEITITATDPRNLRRYDGVSAVGLAEVSVTDRSGRTPVGDDVVRLPTDLLSTAGPRALDHPLAIVLTRERTAGAIAVRSSPELAMARSFELPQGRSFTLAGQVRLSNSAVADNVTDTALGIPTQLDGGITATSSRHLPGGLSNRAMAAIDGDPTTWWSPGFLDQHGDYLAFKSAAPVTVDRLELTVINDGRHSVPRRLWIDVGDGFSDPERQVVELPPIADQQTANGQITVELPLDHPMTGSDVTVTIADEPDAVRDVLTRDYFSNKLVPMPVGIVELGIEGLTAPARPEAVDDGCRTDLVEVDGRPLGVSLAGSTNDLLAGRPVGLQSCDGAPLELPAGTSTIRTADGSTIGLDVDHLTLRSADGGDADTAEGALVSAPAPGPAVHIDGQSRSSYDLTVTGATEPFWLVLGQSHNAGWTATVDGKKLDGPVLVDGYANGWEIGPGAVVEVHLEWTPQRVVNGALWASLAAIIVALMLAAWPSRNRPHRGEASASVPLDARPSMPRPFRWQRVLRYAGPRPSRSATVFTIVGAGAFGALAIGPIPGVVLAVSAALGLRVARARPLMTLGGPVIFALCVGFVWVRQITADLPPGFDWPTYFEIIHQPAWTALALVCIDAVIDRCWMRRWWPSESPPT